MLPNLLVELKNIDVELHLFRQSSIDIIDYLDKYLPIIFFV